jgi:hypothetical protein
MSQSFKFDTSTCDINILIDGIIKPKLPITFNKLVNPIFNGSIVIEVSDPTELINDQLVVYINGTENSMFYFLEQIKTLDSNNVQIYTSEYKQSLITSYCSAGPKNKQVKPWPRDVEFLEVKPAIPWMTSIENIEVKRFESGNAYPIHVKIKDINFTLSINE